MVFVLLPGGLSSAGAWLISGDGRKQQQTQALPLCLGGIGFPEQLSHHALHVETRIGEGRNPAPHPARRVPKVFGRPHEVTNGRIGRPDATKRRMRSASGTPSRMKAEMSESAPIDSIGGRLLTSKSGGGGCEGSETGD